jgi:hypothetical protein
MQTAEVMQTVESEWTRRIFDLETGENYPRLAKKRISRAIEDTDPYRRLLLF